MDNRTDDLSDLDALQEEIQLELGAAGRKVMGGAAAWVLHCTKVLYILYSAFHSIAATAAYAGAGAMSQGFQVVGIISVEITIMALYVAFMTSRISGTSMKIAAGVTYAVGFAATVVTIIGDSQVNAGAVVPLWLANYLVWVLPALPAAMAVGGFFTHHFEPARMRARSQAEQLEQSAALVFQTQQAGRRARLNESKRVENVKLNARSQVLGHIDEFFKLPVVRQAAHKAAASRLPDILRQAGIGGIVDIDGDGERDTLEEILAALTAGATPTGSAPDDGDLMPVVQQQQGLIKALREQLAGSDASSGTEGN